MELFILIVIVGILIFAFPDAIAALIHLTISIGGALLWLTAILFLIGSVLFGTIL